MKKTLLASNEKQVVLINEAISAGKIKLVDSGNYVNSENKKKAYHIVTVKGRRGDIKKLEKEIKKYGKKRKSIFGVKGKKAAKAADAKAPAETKPENTDAK